jgi:hypothetical protein
VTKFPGGLFVELANSRIASLEAEANERTRPKPTLRPKTAFAIHICSMCTMKAEAKER